MSKEETEQIEYVEVTIKVPKAVMDFLRRLYNNPVEWLEYNAVDLVRADLDAMTGKELVELFNLEPVFKTVLNDP